MTFRSDRGIRGLDNLREGKFFDEKSVGVVLRGKKLLVRRAGIHKQQYRVSRDGGSRANLALRIGQVRSPA